MRICNPIPRRCALCYEILSQDVGQTVIKLDTLDECCERELLIEIINDIRQHELQKTHICLTSQSFPYVEEWSEALVLSVDRVEVGGALVDSDILAYIKEKLQSDQGLKRWKKLHKVQDDIGTTLMDKAGGMETVLQAVLGVKTHC